MRVDRSDPELKRAVDADLVRELYRRSRVTIALFIPFVLLLHGVLGSTYRHGTGVAWALNAALALILVKLAAVLGFARMANVRLRYWIFTALTASIGVCFGVLNAFAYPRASAVQLAMLATCQAALSSLALVSMAGSIATFLLFILPNMGTLAALAALRPKPELGEVFALMLALCIASLVLVDWYVHSSLKRGLALRRKLTEMALHDPPTGLRNRRYVTEFMASEASLAVRSGRASLTRNSKTVPYRFDVILLDIDHFKLLNDTRGHEVGDAVLVKVGQILRGALREQDIAARRGGEEFLVIARNVEKGSIGLSERIRLAIADRGLYFAMSHGRKKSVGIAPGENFGDLPAFSWLLETDLDDAQYRGWIRFLPEEDLHQGLALAS
jgi:diguanylate cyclase (GGDEF)-like protein